MKSLKLWLACLKHFLGLTMDKTILLYTQAWNNNSLLIYQVPTRSAFLKNPVDACAWYSFTQCSQGELLRYGRGDIQQLLHDNEKLLKKNKVELFICFQDLRYKHLHHDCPTRVNHKVIKHAYYCDFVIFCVDVMDYNRTFNPGMQMCM